MRREERQADDREMERGEEGGRKGKTGERGRKKRGQKKVVKGGRRQGKESWRKGTGRVINRWWGDIG